MSKDIVGKPKDISEMGETELRAFIDSLRGDSSDDAMALLKTANDRLDYLTDPLLSTPGEAGSFPSSVGLPPVPTDPE